MLPKQLDKREYLPPDCVPIYSIGEFESLYKDYIVHTDINLTTGVRTLYVEYPWGNNDYGNGVHKFKARFNTKGCTLDRPPDSWVARKYDPYNELEEAGM